MSNFTSFETFEDACSFEITSKSLFVRNVNEESKSPTRTVADIDWNVFWFPGGYEKTDKGYVSIFVYVSAPCKIAVKCAIEGTNINRSLTKTFLQRGFYGWSKFDSKQTFIKHIKNEVVVVNCSLQILVAPRRFLTNIVFPFKTAVVSDFELIVENNSIKTTKALFSMISPVFNAMLSHNMVEVKTGQIIINDFSYEVVQHALNYIFGRETENIPFEILVEILRFADKYDIEIPELEPVRRRIYY